MAGENGDEFIRAFIGGAAIICTGGLLALEIGHDQPSR